MANTIAYLGSIAIPTSLGRQGIYWVRATLGGDSSTCTVTSFPANCPIKTIRGVFGPHIKHADIPLAGVASSTGFTATLADNGTLNEFVDFFVFGDSH